MNSVPRKSILGHLLKLIMKACFSWADLFIVIEPSEIQGGSSVFVLRRPDLACIWGGNDVLLSQFSLQRVLPETCDNFLDQFWEPRARPKMLKHFGCVLGAGSLPKIFFCCLPFPPLRLS